MLLAALSFMLVTCTICWSRILDRAANPRPRGARHRSHKP